MNNKGETSKAHDRRVREGFFEKFCQGKGIDLGVGRLGANGPDPVTPDVRGWDKDDGDATFMEGVPDESYDFVHASHIIEHIHNPVMAIMNWWRILKPGGHLIILAPHRDLYEKRLLLPSRWNHDHKFFLLPDRHEPPNTLGLQQLVNDALYGCIGSSPEMIYIKTCDEGWKPCPEEVHSQGEYSIEMVVRKN